jgi:hypothetical protein
MACRIHSSVSKGEIDNRKRGSIRGRIWLAGRDQPLRLELSGNCGRDLAGCLVTFVNPIVAATDGRDVKSLPSEKGAADLAIQQAGNAGDITASRKVRVFDVPLEEALRIRNEGGRPPEHLANVLYIEWFSDANGRVVIESSDYAIEISTPAWTLSPEEESEQIEASRQAMRDWLHRLDRPYQFDEPAPYDPAAEKPMDEFTYEKLLRESDARTDKYLELVQKYDGHPDREKIVAREMGWEWLEEALEADERGALPPREKMEVPVLEPNPATEGVDWIRDEDGDIHHPLTKRAFESAMAMWHFCNDRKLLDDDGDADLQEMIFEFQTAGAKIAGALDSMGYSDDEERLIESGLVVASLKRALNYLHKSIAAGERVAEKKLLPREQLDPFRADLFEVREEVLRLMEQFRGENR